MTFNKNKPFIDNQTIFTPTNYAPYGSTIASYPADIKIVSYDNYELVSGQPYNGTIVV